MKRKLLIVLFLLQGCSIGPRRLQSDCTWKSRTETTTENVVGYTSAGLMLGGFATFLGAFIGSRGDIAGPAFAATATGILGMWWVVGAFEEIPAPFSRQRMCQKKWAIDAAMKAASRRGDK